MKIDLVKEALKPLENKDLINLEGFIKRHKNSKNRKDLQLLNLIVHQPELKPSENQMLLFGKKNRKAYHQLRNRLLEDITHFVALKFTKESNEPRLQNLMKAAQYYLQLGQIQLGWKLILKCETVALKEELYQELSHIYQIQIRYAHEIPDVPLKQISENKDRCLKALNNEYQLEIILAGLKIKLRNIKTHNPGIPLKTMVDTLLSENSLNLDNNLSPKFIYSILSSVRSLTLSTKKYIEFEELIRPILHRILKNGSTHHKDQYYISHLLYMTAHVLYRNRKFEECRQYHELFEEQIQQNQKHFIYFFPKSILLQAALESYTGNNEKSIELIEDAIQQYSKKMTRKSLLDMSLNLGVYYFQNENYKRCGQILIKLPKATPALVNKMGKEWFIRKKLIHIIQQFELGNLDMTSHLISDLKTKFKTTLQNPLYVRVHTFLGYIMDCIEKPEFVSSEEYKNHVQDTLERWPLDSEDIQAMAFFCWLKAKMLKKKYYQVLVETVNKGHQMFGSGLASLDEN